MSEAVPLADLAAYVDDLLEVSRYAETEPEANGITLDTGLPVSRIAAAVNTSFASISGAAEAGAQLLIVHHTTWPTIDLDLMPEKEQALRDAGLSLYGAHASLDASPSYGNGSRDPCPVTLATLAVQPPIHDSSNATWAIVSRRQV